MHVNFVRTLGVIAIAHAVSHAILPVRGSFEPAWLVRDYTPILLYILTTIGFIIAGLGLFGVRRLTLFISPLLVLSSALSSVAIVRFGDRDLFPALALNVVLLVLGLWRSYAGWPQEEPVEDRFEHVWSAPSR
jgi:hypothetical protein